MSDFKFSYKNEEFILSEDNLTFIENEEVEGFSLEKMLDILKEGKDKVDFGYEYYGDNCESCGSGVVVDKKYFRFLECHFYIFTKRNEFVISNISEEFLDTSYTKLKNENKIDNSYIVSVVVCEGCKNFSVEVEQCDM